MPQAQKSALIEVNKEDISLAESRAHVHVCTSSLFVIIDGDQCNKQFCEKFHANNNNSRGIYFRRGSTPVQDLRVPQRPVQGQQHLVSTLRVRGSQCGRVRTRTSALLGRIIRIPGQFAGSLSADQRHLRVFGAIHRKKSQPHVSASLWNSLHAWCMFPYSLQTTCRLFWEEY